MDAERAQRVEASTQQPQLWCVYIIQCRSGKLYTGMTSHLLRRWYEHQHGGARFTKGDPPVCAILVEPYPDRSQAAARERQLKGWTRRKKLALAAQDFALLKKL
jgi:putative endonuclease